jgi:hypothetical protein
MKAIVTLAALIIGSFVVFAGFMLLKPDTPKTQEEVDLQLQLDNNKQQHELAVRNSDLDHQLSLNQQKFDHENVLKQQQLQTEAALQQYQMQHNLGVEQAKLAHEAILAQQNMRKDVEIRQLDLKNQVEMQREQLTAENKQKMMELDHEVALKRQQEEGAQQRIYLLFAGGLVLVIVIAGVILVLVRNYKEAQVRLRSLEQTREFQLEEGRNIHQMRMKALDIMASFPQDERKEIILEVMNLNTPEKQPKMLNTDSSYDELALPASQPDNHQSNAQDTHSAPKSQAPLSSKAEAKENEQMFAKNTETQAVYDPEIAEETSMKAANNKATENNASDTSEEHIVYAPQAHHASNAKAQTQAQSQSHKKSRNIYRRKKQKSQAHKSNHYHANDNIIDLNNRKSADST